MNPMPNLPQRLASLDAYRGFVMLLMMGEVLQFGRVAAAQPGSGFWQFMSYQQSHMPWVGCSLHDLIQPSFSFIVGVALPFSIASRLGARPIATAAVAPCVLAGAVACAPRRVPPLDDDRSHQLDVRGHALANRPGLRVPVPARVPARSRPMACAGGPAGWLLGVLRRVAVARRGFDWKSAASRPIGRTTLTGFAAHWNKNTNPAWAFDTWFLNLFPRGKPFTNNAGGYATLSFIPTLGTMILGLLAGGVLRSERPPWAKVRWLAVAGVGGAGRRHGCSAGSGSARS